MFYPYTKYHYHSSSHLSINFCFLFYAYIISRHIGNWTLTKMKKIKRKLLPKLLISWTLTFNISATECLIEIKFSVLDSAEQGLHYNMFHYKGNLNHWLSQPCYLKQQNIVFLIDSMVVHSFLGQGSGSNEHGTECCLTRASNSPALRGSLPPGHYFSRSPGKHVKSPASVGKTLENNYRANFHRQGGMQPQIKNHTYQFRF